MEKNLPVFAVEHLYAFKPVLSFLNSKDRDILYLIFISQKKQKDVQEILNRSQPSLCYDIKRIRRRLRFIFYLNSVFDIFVNFMDSNPDGFTKFELEVLALMFYTSSFTMAARVLARPGNAITQVRVRYTFDRVLRKLEEAQEWEVYELFMVVRYNLNLVRRTYRSEGNFRRELFIPQ
jgi:hypothetical protein